MSSILPEFRKMSPADQLNTVLCPTSTAAVKIVNKYIKLLFKARDQIDSGIALINYPTGPPDFDIFSDDEFCEEDYQSDISDQEWVK